MHEFDAAAVGADGADHGGEIDLAKTSSDFKLDGVADGKFPRGLQISAAQADGFYAREARRCTLNLGAKRRVQWNSSVASRADGAGTRLWRCAKSPRCLLERGARLDQRQRIFRGGAESWC